MGTGPLGAPQPRPVAAPRTKRYHHSFCWNCMQISRRAYIKNIIIYQLDTTQNVLVAVTNWLWFYVCVSNMQHCGEVLEPYQAIDTNHEFTPL
jgi:hypothetical protein